MDAIPGRVNCLWLHIRRDSVFYGQCSEICGVKHGYMPIVVDTIGHSYKDTDIMQATGELSKIDFFWGRKYCVSNSINPCSVSSKETLIPGFLNLITSSLPPSFPSSFDI